MAEKEKIREEKNPKKPWFLMILIFDQDSKWKTMEKENPQLFAEAVALVAPESCDKHAECLKKGGNR